MKHFLGGVAVVTCTLVVGIASAQEQDALSYYREARIDWRQQEGTALTIAMNKHPYTESLIPLIPEFEELTGMSVDYLILPEGEYFTKLAADLSQQSGDFSVIMAGSIRNWQYVPAGWIVPLDDFLNDPELTDLDWYGLDDFYPSLVSGNRWTGELGRGVGEGPLYAIPVLEESYILAYRKDLFDKYGIAVPTTLDEMADAARLIKENEGINGIVARGTPTAPTVSTGFMSLLKSYSNGEWTEFDDDMHANFSDPVSVEFTDKWVNMIRESGPDNWANMQWYDAMEMFSAGRAGMTIDSDFFAASYEDPSKSAVAGQVGYALVPRGSAGVPQAQLWAWSLAMSSATQNKDAAWLFIQWATSKRALLNATVNFQNYNPARRSVYDDPRVQQTMGAWGDGSYISAVEQNLETARVAWKPQSERGRVADIWARAVHEVYFERLSAQEALERADTEIDKVLRDAGITQ